MLIDSAYYVAGVRHSGNTLNEMYEKAQQEYGFIWVGLKDPEPAELKELANIFDLHELQIEDALKGNQRPKFDDYGDKEFVTLKTLYYEDDTSQVETGDFMIYLGSNFVVTIRHGDGVALHAVRAQLEANPEALALGPYAVLHSVLDKLIDAYREIATELESDISELESKVFSDVGGSQSAELYFLKREVIEFRRGIEPLKPILIRLLALPQISGTSLRPFFHDMSDHLEIAIDAGNSADQLVSTAIQADLAQLQVQQNNDMRKISAWVALAAVPTMMAGIYGMNFENMPELSVAWGYPAVLVGMISVSFGLYRKFKKSGWL
ncbi:MAG: hypothetical protein RL038_829 [Actinomycetota bacterium]